LDDKPHSREKKLVNKNEENNNNLEKINVRKIDSMNNYNTNNSANINMRLEKKILKKDEICLTDENQIKNITNIKVCKIIEIKNDENKNLKILLEIKVVKKHLV
jgi:hypothetical protein